MASLGSSLLRNAQSDSLSFSQEWDSVRPTLLDLLHQRNVSKADWQGLFFSVHRISSWLDPSAEKILREIYVEVKAYVDQANLRITRHTDEESLLRAYITEWAKFYAQAQYLPMPFLIIEQSVYGNSSGGGDSRSYCSRPGSKKPSANPQEQDSAVKRIMLETWDRVIFSTIRHQLQSAAIKLVTAERNGEVFDSALVQGVRESYGLFVALCVEDKFSVDVVEERATLYKTHFEHAYLDATEGFYKGRAAQVLEENGVQNYMQYADTKLAEEQQRAEKYLDTRTPHSVAKLIERCVDVLVVAFQEQILAECPALIRSNDVQKLRMLYRLLNRTPAGMPPILEFLEQHIRAEGLADMAHNAQTITTDPEKYVEQLLKMFNNFSSLVRDAFYDDPRFLTARDKAFQDVLNDVTVFKLDVPVSSRHKGGQIKVLPESKCPELLANYCDLLLRKTAVSRKLSSEEIDSKLNDVLLVLKYVQNKDVFVRFHKMHLARRLILDMSADQEIEETLVNRLRESGMPADYVNKLYRMLQDIELNKDLNKSFKAQIYVSNNNRNTVAETVTIKILNAGAWFRAGDRAQVSLPREMEDLIPEVEEFYKRQHSGRKLQWMHQWSNGSIQFASSVGRYDLEVTTFQMAVLFCWNDRPQAKLEYETLRLATQLPDLELRRTLLSLVAFPKLKHQVLLTDCTGGARDYTDSTQFYVNPQFAIIKNGREQPRGRINLIGRLQMQTAATSDSGGHQGQPDEHDDIVQLRIYRVQEAVVKIMKMRRKCQSAALQTELVEMLKHMFLPSRKLIKEQIEWLIENQYLKRDDNDMNCFIYLA